MKRRLAVFAMLGFMLLFAYDLFFLETPKKLQIDSSPPTGAPLDAAVQEKGVRYDPQSHSVKGTFNLYLRAVDDRDFHSVAFSPAYAGMREWLAIISKERRLGGAAAQQVGDCQLQLSEEMAKGNPVSSATFECKETVISSDSGGKEIWYPFDSYRIVMAPVACINTLDGACGKSSQAQLAVISSFSVLIGDQNLTGKLVRDSAKPDTYVLTLKRRFFVRMVSVTSLLLSLAFLIYLLAAGDPKDLVLKSLGFFGTLWGLRVLIVPAAISIFPTAVDFAILTIFCVLFIMVLGKL